MAGWPLKVGGWRLAGELAVGGCLRGWLWGWLRFASVCFASVGRESSLNLSWTFSKNFSVNGMASFKMFLIIDTTPTLFFTKLDSKVKIRQVNFSDIRLRSGANVRSMRLDPPGPEDDFWMPGHVLVKIGPKYA